MLFMTGSKTRVPITDSPALLIIGVHKDLAEPSLGLRNNPDAEDNMFVLLEAWREHQLPIIHNSGSTY